MAGQPGDEGVNPRSGAGDAGKDDETVAVAGSSAIWIQDQARALGLEPEEYLDRILISLRAIESGDPLDDLVTEEEYADLRDRVDALDDDLDTKIQDVRDRVIQVKREADAKAPPDHGHESLEKSLASGLERVEEVAQRIQSLETDFEDVEARLERGFENYEEILEYLVDRSDDVTAELTTLREATTAIGRNLEVLRRREARRQRADALKEEANRKGVTDARCESCGSDVNVAQLTEPACPVCSTDIAGVTPKQGFFGTATLDEGSPPALEEPEESPSSTISDLQKDAEDREADSATESDPTTLLDEDGSLVDVTPTDPGADPEDADE